MSKPGWKPVTKTNPCPACLHPDWCAWAPDGNLKCERAIEAPADMKLIVLKDGGGIFAFEERAVIKRNWPTKPATNGAELSESTATPSADLGLVHRAAVGAVTDAALSALAADLGVTISSLRALEVGWMPRKVLDDLGANGQGWAGNRPDGAWAFPERDGQGRIVGFGLRTEDGRKGCPSGDAGCRRGLAVPSNLSELPDPVLIVEGASDVAACVSVGATAVGRPSNTGGGEMLAQLLAGREVIVVGENDKKENGTWPGQAGAIKISADLAAAWGKRVVRAMPPENVKDVRAWVKGEFSEGIDQVDDERRVQAGRALLQLLRDRVEIAAPQNVLMNVSVEMPWPYPGLIPESLPEAMPAAQPFHYAMLPDALRPWISDITERLQCPADFPAVAAVISLASVVGRKIGIRPKRLDDWVVVPNLWGGAVGRPGVMKTPSLAEPLRYLRSREADAKRKFDEEMVDAEAASMVAEAKKKYAAGSIKKNLSDQTEALRLARESLGEVANGPTRRRYIVNDTTVEKLGVILNENPTGVMVLRDELVGFLKSLDKDGQEGARTFYLESWNGTGPYAFDRIGRGTLDIDAAITSILGGIQPGPLGEYLAQLARQGAGDDGLIQRFQLLVWPDVSKEWVNVDREPDIGARCRADEVFDRLCELDPASVGAMKDQHEDDGIPYLRFDEDAQAEFDRWRAGLERRLRSGELHPAMESHLSKYRSLVPSLALLFHLADGHHGPVGLASLNRALAWVEYLETHANRVYSQVSRAGVVAGRALAKKIIAGEVKSGFALRAVYRRGWSGLGSSEDAKSAVEVLVEHGWVAEVPKPTQGRFGTVYVINPAVYASFGPDLSPKGSPGTDRTDGSPDQDPSGGSVSSSGGGGA